MATFQYYGLGIYDITFANKMVTLNEEELSEIFQHFANSPEDNIAMPHNDKLAEEYSEVAEELEKTRDLLKASVKKLQNIAHSLDNTIDDMDE